VPAHGGPLALSRSQVSAEFGRGEDDRQLEEHGWHETFVTSFEGSGRALEAHEDAGDDHPGQEGGPCGLERKAWLH